MSTSLTESHYSKQRQPKQKHPRQTREEEENRKLPLMEDIKGKARSDSIQILQGEKKARTQSKYLKASKAKRLNELSHSPERGRERLGKQTELRAVVLSSRLESMNIHN